MTRPRFTDRNAVASEIKAIRFSQRELDAIDAARAPGETFSAVVKRLLRKAMEARR